MQHSNSQITGQWEWKSNPNPYSQSEEAQWTPYLPHENDLLEKAFINQQAEVDLGDHIVSIKDMLQKRKDNAYKQRPIRRNIDEDEEERNQEENIRAERFFGAETPKTFNDAFGNLEDYLKFFQNRGPEIQRFAILVHDIETTDNLDLLNEKIQFSIVECIKNEAKKIPMPSKFQKRYENKLLMLFQETATSIKQFYANILKAYTMAGFLYQNLNRYLRNEDWGQLDSLLPYAYCLCKAFLRSEFTSNNPQTSMTVFRGARFDEATLSFYDLNLVKNFCWNGVTSTSKKLEIAERFMGSSPDPKKPISVMFNIEIPLEITENTQIAKWIDIKPYSALPNEDEVVLPPGSVFQLTGISRDKNIAKINLKLIINIEKLAHQGQIMHGALQSKMSNNTSLKLVCLEERELTDALTHLKGNQLIEVLEFSLCKFDKKIALALAETLEKTPSLKSLIFTAPITEDLAHWSEILKHLTIERLKIYDYNAGDHRLSLLGQGIRELLQLKSLDINFSKSQITDKGLNNLCQEGIKNLTSLTSLTLNFESCNEISDQGVKNLSQEYLQNLTSLALNFSYCHNITDEGLNHLGSNLLKYLGSLTSLALNFASCSEITDKGLSHLGFQGMKHLTSLSLNFNSCKKITDEGLNNLSLKHLTSLISLSLDFYECHRIASTGINNLCKEGIQYLTSLRSLNLNFDSCLEITDEDCKNLGLKHLTLLTSLTLNFRSCSKITDQGLNNLCQQGIKYLTSLTSLALNMNSCPEITAESINALCREGLKDLTSLTSLTVKFGSPKITDEGLSLNSEGLKYLTSLISLNLGLDASKQITDEGLKNLSSKGLKYLTSLTSLSLDFGPFEKITDESLKHLCREGINYLTSLTSLSLNFINCKNITDKGVEILLQDLRCLTQLTSLALNFEGCKRITEKGHAELKKIAESYTQIPGEVFHDPTFIAFQRKIQGPENPALSVEKTTTLDSFKSFQTFIGDPFATKANIVMDGELFFEIQQNIFCGLGFNPYRGGVFRSSFFKSFARKIFNRRTIS